MAAHLAYVNVLCWDIDRLVAFYQVLFGFEEIAEHRAPIHRALRAGGCALGFNADPAHGLLGLTRGSDEPRDRVYLTFELADPSAVDATAGNALDNGVSPD